MGQPPVIRDRRPFGRLETKVLEPEDTMSLMKSITPERCQQELQEVGGSDFGFAFGDIGPVPRVGLQAEGLRGDGAAVDSGEAVDLRGVGRPPVLANCVRGPAGWCWSPGRPAPARRPPWPR